MTGLPHLLNRVWKASCRRSARTFRVAADNLATVQERDLLARVRANRDTRFGRAHGFAEIRSVNDFRARVPLCTYADLEADILRIAAGEPNVLTAEPVTLLEPTSGTTSGAKFIPYTAGLHREFQQAINPWICDLFSASPSVMRGRAYWAVSPAMKVTSPPDCILPVGFASDEEYLGPVARRCARVIQAVPPGLQAVSDVRTHQYLTLRYLVGVKDLRLVSVWNPSFLTLMLDAFTGEWAHDIVNDIRTGSCTPPGGLPPSWSAPARPDPRRAREVERVLWSWREGLLAEPWPHLWPRLRVLSCWADGWAEASAAELHRRLPQAVIQPKGLLATEAVVTIPFRVRGRTRHVLSPRSHFYEFLDLETGEERLAHEVEDGRRYEVVVTTAGGLYRYRLGDRVQVEGRHRRLPIFRFLGKTPGVSDLVGEKLHADHVSRVLERVLDRCDLRPDECFLLPVPDPKRPHYQVCLHLRNPVPDLEDFLYRVDVELGDNPHYRYARDLGQLGPPAAVLLSTPAYHRLLQRQAERGRLGTSKQIRLANPEWKSLLEEPA